MNEIRSQRLILILLVLLTGVTQLSAAIPPVTGTVTYISSTHVYVKFSTTEGLFPGDTLFRENNGELNPAILIKSTSSLSCMGTPIDKNLLTVHFLSVLGRSLSQPHRLVAWL